MDSARLFTCVCIYACVYGLSSTSKAAQRLENVPIFGKLDHVKNEVASPERQDDRAEMTLPPGISIAKSKVESNGAIGVWTDSYIPSRTIFGPLEGVVVPVEKIDDLNHYYLWKVKVNATSTHYLYVKTQSVSSWLRYPTFATKPHQQNLVQLVIHGQLYFYTRTAIEAGTELAVAVEDEHVKRLKIDINTWCLNPLFDESRWPFFYTCGRGSCAHKLGQCVKPEELPGVCPGCYGFETNDCPLVGDLNIVKDVQVSSDGYVKDRDIKTIPPGVSVRNSPVAGLGAFAEQYFPSRTRFGPYDGFIVRDIYNTKRNSIYTWLIFENGEILYKIDAIEHATSNWLRYVNTANNITVQNLISVQCGNMVYYVSFRPIQAGEELFNWYGSKYDTYLGIKRPLATWNPRHDELRLPFFHSCPDGNCIEEDPSRETNLV